MTDDESEGAAANAAAFHSLRGCAPISQVADCLRKGLASEELLTALADLIDPDAAIRAVSDLRLVLVGENDRPIEWERRRDAGERARTLTAHWIDGIREGDQTKAIVIDAQRHTGASARTVYRFNPQLKLLNGYLVSTKDADWDLAVKIATLFPR